MEHQLVRGRKKIAIWICLGAFLFSVICPLFQFVQAKTTESIGSTETLACTYTPHHHEESCYENGEQICGKAGADIIVHQHDDKCYDENGSLVCALDEVALHTHGDDCCTEEKTLICGQEETDGHTHSDDCYETVRTLTCELEEVVLHTHSDDCYDESGALTCELPEVIEHQHTSDCFVTEETVHVSGEKLSVEAMDAATTAGTTTTYSTGLSTSLVSSNLIFTDANGNLYTAYSINDPSAKAYPTGQSYASTTTNNDTYRSLATNANRFYSTKYDWPAILWCLWLGYPYNQNLTIDSTSTNYTGYNFLKRAKETYGFSDAEAEAALRAATQLAVRHFADYNWSGIQGTYNSTDNSGTNPTTVDQKLLCLAGEIVQYAWEKCGTTPSGIEATLYKPSSDSTANLVVTKLEQNVLTIQNTAQDGGGTNTMYADLTITNGGYSRKESISLPANGSVAFSNLPMGYSYTLSLTRDKNDLSITGFLSGASAARLSKVTATGSQNLPFSFTESNIYTTNTVSKLETIGQTGAANHSDDYIGYSSIFNRHIQWSATRYFSSYYVMGYDDYFRYLPPDVDTTQSEAYALYQQQDDAAEVAYCFNSNLSSPGSMQGLNYGYNTDASNKNAYFSIYKKLENADADTFDRLANGNTVSADKLYEMILKIALNGYPNDYSGYQEQFGLTDDEFRATTQMAIWHYTDSVEVESSANVNLLNAFVQLIEDDCANVKWSGKKYSGYQYNASLNKVTDEVLNDEEYTSFINLYRTLGTQQRGTFTQFVKGDGLLNDFWVGYTDGEATDYPVGTGGFKTYQNLLNVGSVKAAKERNGSQLTLRKLVSGTGGSTSDSFTFTINLRDNTSGSLVPVTGTYYVESGVVSSTNTTTAPSYTTLTFDENGSASVKLKHGQQITIYGLPENYYYSIRESNAGNYTPSFSYSYTDGTTASSSKSSVKRKSGSQGDNLYTTDPSTIDSGNNGNSAVTVTCTNTKDTAIPTGVGGVIIWPYALIGTLSLLVLAYLLVFSRRRT